MMLRWLMIPCLLLAGGCQKAAPAGQEEKAQSQAFAPAGDAASGEKDGVNKDGAIKVSVPQIAYVYGYSYSLPSDRIAVIQEKHLAMCDRLGAAHCHVLAMQRAIDDRSSTASLKLAVDAAIARNFGTQLTNATVQAGGSQSDASIEAEDLSKQIVDTEARLRSRQALADRLTALLKTRSGSVADLVAAERAVADVQEEIDAAQSWLADARGRVTTSTIDISYGSDGAIGGSFRASLGAMGSFFAQSLSLLITLMATLLPWAVVIGAAIFAVRYLRQRFAKADE